VIKIAKSAVLFMIMTIAGSACLDDPDCYALNNNQIGITFKDFVTSATKPVGGLSITADTVALIESTTASKVVIPLNFYENATTYTIFLLDSGYQLTLGYKSQSQFVSAECGQRYVISDLTVLSHTFDSVRLVSARPGNNANANNLEIFW
jgi:hypothetical protein